MDADTDNRDSSRNLASREWPGAAEPGVTTQQLIREIYALEKVINTRLEAMDKAIIVFNDNLTRVPTNVDRQVSALGAVVDERFNIVYEKLSSVATQFAERDVRSAQDKQNSKDFLEAALISRDTAVAAALTAQKESYGEQNKASAQSIAKSEAGTAESIKALQAILQSAVTAITDQVADIKGRLIRIEEGRLGQVAAAGNQQVSYTNVMGVVGLVVGAAIGLGGITMAIVNSKPEPAAVERVIVTPVPAPHPPTASPGERF